MIFLNFTQKWENVLEKGNPENIFFKNQKIEVLNVDAHRVCILSMTIASRLFFFIFGATDKAIILCSGLFFVLYIPILYLIGKEIFDKKTAIISTVLYTISLNILYYSTSGLTDSLYIFILISTIYVLLKSKVATQLFIVGVLLGLSRLVRINSTFFLLPFLIYIYRNKNTESIYKNCLFFIIGYFISTIPLFIVSYLSTGDLFYSPHTATLAMGSEIYPKKYLSRSLLQVDSFEFLANYPIVFIKKYVINLLGYYHQFIIGITKPIILSLFVCGLFIWPKNKQRNELLILFIGMVMLQLLIVSAAYVRIRYFHIFIPLFIIFAVDNFFFLFNNYFPEKRILKTITYVCLAIILLLPTLAKFVLENNSDQRGQYNYLADLFKGNTNNNDTILTDIPDAVGWYGMRKAIGLPITTSLIKEINDNYKNIDAIFLTDEHFYNPYIDISEEWKDLLHNTPSVYKDYKFAGIFNNGETVAVLYKKL